MVTYDYQINHQHNPYIRLMFYIVKNCDQGLQLYNVLAATLLPTVSHKLVQCTVFNRLNNDLQRRSKPPTATH